jgi:hypothetical protein
MSVCSMVPFEQARCPHTARGFDIHLPKAQLGVIALDTASIPLQAWASFEVLAPAAKVVAPPVKGSASEGPRQ